MSQKQLAALAAVVATAVVAATPASATYPPRAGDLQVSRSAVANGGSLVVRGAGFRANSLVRIALQDADERLALGTRRANSAGAIRTTVVIPRAAEDGRWRVVMTGVRPNGGTLRLTATITVR